MSENEIEMIVHPMVGQVITDYHVLGEEKVEERWVGADLLVDVPKIGRFFLNIATKQHFAEDYLKSSLEEVEQAERILSDSSDAPTEEIVPFVLNDDEITDEVLARKFRGRVIEQDLAASLWYDGPLAEPKV